MGTASRNVNPNSISYNGPTAAQLTALRGKIEAGDVINAADINTLIGYINSWDNHTHNYTDLWSRATFGNTGTRTDQTVSRDSAQHDQAQSNISTVSSGDTITAAKHNSLRTNCNNLRSHKHSITDRTS